MRSPNRIASAPSASTDASREIAGDWWDDLLPARAHAKPPGANEMLRLIAYDIADPKRLYRVARACEDFGVRVQKSLFECWLDEPQFAALWKRLDDLLEPATDRIVAYTLDAAAVKRRQTAGEAMECSEEQVAFVM